MAYNLAKYGTLSHYVDDAPDVKPSHFREPAYPILLAGVLRVLDAPENIRLQCLRGPAPNCGNINLWAKTINIIFLALVSLTTFFAAREIARSSAAGITAAVIVGFGSTYLSTIDNYLTEIPAAFFLVLHAYLLYRLVNKKAGIATALGCGVAGGLLVLTKAAYAYWFPVLAVVILVLLLVKRFDGRKLAAQLVIVSIVGSALTFAWVARNYVALGEATLSSRGGGTLAIRAEYTTVTWGEYWKGYLYYTPLVGEKILQKITSTESYVRLDENDPGSFYRQFISRSGGEMAARQPDYRNASDAEIGKTARAIIADNWIKQVALVPLFAYRGMFVRVGFNVFRDQPILNSKIVTAGLVGTTMLMSLFFFPALVLVSLTAVRRRDLALLAFLGPALYGWGIHSVATYYLPRFSMPMVPVLAVALVWTVMAALRWQRSGRAGKV